MPSSDASNFAPSVVRANASAVAWFILDAVGAEMANTAADLPAHLQNHHAKYRVIHYLLELRVPNRFRRKVLQDWGARHSVEITVDDYNAVTAPDVPRSGL